MATTAMSVLGLAFWVGVSFIVSSELIDVANAGDDQRCGNVNIITNTTKIQLPLNNANLDVLNCTWKINSVNDTADQPLFIFFSYIQLDVTDKIWLFDGFELTEVNISDVHPFVAILNAQNSTVTLTTSAEDVSRALRFQLSPKCVFAMEGESGVITSPRHHPRENLTQDIYNCQWQFNMHLAYQWITVSVSHVELNETDTLTLSGQGKDGDKKITGLQPDIVLPVNRGNLTFTSKHTESHPEGGEMFKLYYAAMTPGCYQRIPITEKKTISLPPSPLSVPLTNCFWILETAPNTTMSITASATSRRVGEAEDGVVIINDEGRHTGHPIAVFSVHNIPTDYISSSGNITWVGIDSALSSPQIQLSVTPQALGGALSGSGTFGTAPKTEKATTTDDIIYLLTVDEGFQVYVQFAPGATFTDVSVIDAYEGHSEGRQLAHFHTSDLHPVTSSSNKLLIIARNFKAPASFEANFTGIKQGAKKVSTDDSDSFEVDNVHTSYNNWQIQPLHADENSLIVLTISRLSLGLNDSLIIYGSSSEDDSKIIAEFNCSKCSSTGLSSVVTAPIPFHLNSVSGAYVKCNNVTSGGCAVVANYMTEKTCNEDVTVESTYNLTTPSYPSAYPLRAKCSWKISVAKDQGLYIKFSELDLAKSHSLKITTLSGVKLIDIVGPASVLPNDYFLDAGVESVSVQWQSEPTATTELTRGRGFNIFFESFACGKNFSTETSFDLKSPGYPKPVTPKTKCLWIIDLPNKTQDSSAQVLNFTFNTNAKHFLSNLSILEIRDGNNANAAFSHIDQNMTNTGIMLSKLSKLFIRYEWDGPANDTESAIQLTGTATDCPTKEYCLNGICMHAYWRCNNYNDCGDYSDEANCTAAPLPAPVIQSGGVPVWGLIFACLIFAIAGAMTTLFAPIVIRRVRRGGSYSEFSNTVDM